MCVCSEEINFTLIYKLTSFKTTIGLSPTKTLYSIMLDQSNENVHFSLAIEPLLE